MTSDRPTDSSQEEALSPPPWLCGSGARTLTLIIGVAIVGVAGAIIAFSVTRDRPEEMAAGVIVALLGALYSAWAVRSHSPTLPLLVGLGALTQLAAVSWYYYSGFARDATAYSNAARVILDPEQELSGRFAFERSEWSNFVVAQLTATIYRVTGPSQMAAFITFSTLSVIGKSLVARALLRLVPLLGRRAALVALLVMVYPSLALWLSPIGKEVPAVLGICMVLAGVLRKPEEGVRISLVCAGIMVTASTRPHVAALLAGAVVVFAATSAMLVSQSWGRRISIVTGAAVFGVGSIMATASFFGVEPTVAGFDAVRDDVSETGPIGDSYIEPRPVRGPQDLPIATSNVLLRPFPHEAGELTSLAQSLETVAFLVVAGAVALRRSHARRLTGVAKRHVRSLRAFAWSYLFVFVYSFSGMYNLGLMSRQRVQATVVVLVLLALGAATTRTPAADARRQPPLLIDTQGSQPAPPRQVAAGQQGPLLVHSPDPDRWGTTP